MYLTKVKGSYGARRISKALKATGESCDESKSVMLVKLTEASPFSFGSAKEKGNERLS